ncbi:bacteriophage Gp15 protein [Anaerotignum neopropionicum]|uniref:Bacteriophage Gp15 protein n=1 Tax=Anaerotignum neopropionicum TaxID=36847 RepID=A0A136WG74_9FIRM|nr:bacteriophage Gp15 family protein [Anaerotignum neopropionicum]KXL53505.1 bacteriophage Gp15 protein [Anaerotignum neopropionicum]
MNLLIDALPQKLWIDEKEYPIRWDFRVGILYELLMLDEDVEGAEKPLLALRLFYPVIPENWKMALEGIQWFYRLGEEEKNFKKNGTHKKQERIYSFEQDAAYIYSAFLEQYSMDLTQEKQLHWWKFRALFQGLGKDTAFCKIMGYRSMEISESIGKEQREFYRRMKALYRLPSSKGEEEKLAAIENALLLGGDLTGVL